MAFDPTRTTLIRRRFQADLNRRFRSLRLAIIDFINTKDALALKEKKQPVFLAREREFEFLTDADKLKSFNDWLRAQIEAEILSASSDAIPDRPWTATYIESAYKRGQLNAYLSARQAEGSSEEFLRTSFNQPEALNKVRLLATRAFEELKGVTASMSSQMNEILSRGMIEGKGPAEIAREMSERIGSLTRSRALLIARTEVIHAHAEGQLDAFKKLGVEALGLKAEWSTAGDDRVCPLCSEKEGQVFTIAEARGMIPLHPNCRCAWIPSV